ALTELEEIIKKLEDGRLPLEDAVKAFERGAELKKICEEKLKNAQLKIEILSEKSEKTE
ncbi:MAG: exodeoxyribonuclease VII small subunit, partial [Alphaproteobacteria bacterium]|nr:exodeoxyribonuclease VII small subunit [Alphaproteobacteria bacterium]